MKSHVNKSLLMMVILLLSAAPLLAGNGFIFELATGLGSHNSPFSTHWNGSVGNDGIYFREYAGRITYTHNKNISFRLTGGWLRQSPRRSFSYLPVYPPIYKPEPSQDVVYFIPSIRLAHDFILIDIGAIIYSTKGESPGYREFYSPLNGSHKLIPSLGLELGGPALFIFANLFNSIPLYSSGLELGLGGRGAGIYEHKAFITAGAYHDIGLGYRGEIRVYKASAIALGMVLGGKDDMGRRDNFWSFTLGIKTALSK